MWKPTARHLKFKPRPGNCGQQRQVVNHWENHYEISNKLNVFLNLKRFCLRHSLNVFDFVPVTFVYSLDCPRFSGEIDHFFRYFKALEIFNLLKKKKFKSFAADARKKQPAEVGLAERSRPSSIDKKCARQGSLPAQPKKPQTVKLLAGDPGKQFCLQEFHQEMLQKTIRFQRLNARLNLSAKTYRTNDATAKKPQSAGLANAKHRIFSRILRVVNHPSRVLDNGLQKFIAGTLRGSQVAIPFATKKPGPKDNFLSSLFSDEKKPLEIPTRESEWSGYYADRLGSSFNCGVNLWLLKVSQYNRGFGIELFKDLRSFCRHLLNFKNGYKEHLPQAPHKPATASQKGACANPRARKKPKTIQRSNMKIRTKRFVIQKYIEDPLLFEGRKFDIRLWVMFTGDLKVLWCREMYVRVSSHPFDLSDLGKFGHLNNIALQKFSSDYDRERAVICVETLERHVRETRDSGFDFDQAIRPKLLKIVSYIGKCFTDKLKPGHGPQSCFEIFGLDFMIDTEMKVWFIEANSNPAITTGNSFLDQLIPRMLDDAFKLTVDKAFPMPKPGSPYAESLGPEQYGEMKKTFEDSVFPLENYKSSENVWSRVSLRQPRSGLRVNQ